MEDLLILFLIRGVMATPQADQENTQALFYFNTTLRN